MKKSTKYSAFIIAALLAVAPVAISGTVKADEKPDVAQSINNKNVNNSDKTVTNKNNNNQKDNDTNSTTNNPVKNMDYATFANQKQNFREKYGDGTKEHPFTIDAEAELKRPVSLKSLDPMELGQVADDHIDYLSNHNQIMVYDYTPDGHPMSRDEQENIEYYYNIYDKNGKELVLDDNDNLNNGDTIVFNGGLNDDAKLNANAWYSWSQPKTLEEYLGKHLTSDLTKYDFEETKMTKGGYLVAAKTDSNGNFAKVNVDNDNEPESITEYIFAPTELKFFILSLSDLQPTTPVETPTQPTEVVQPTQASQVTETAQPTVPTQDVNQATNPVETSVVKKPLMLKHNAFIYTKHGKLVKKHGIYEVLKKYEDIKPLKNAKIVKIKGKKFYQIGKNRYIKVANTTIKPGIKKISTKGIVKGTKHTQIRLYNTNGKYIKKHIKGMKHLKFNAKKIIKGHLYYRIKGTNNWIRANKVRFHK